MEVEADSAVTGGETPPRATPPAAGGQVPSGWPAALGLLATVAGSIAFVVAFVTDASNAWLGGSLALALLGIGVALAYWGRDLAGDEVASEPYPVPHDDVASQTAFADRLQGDAGVVTRRRFLRALLVGALAVFALSQVALVGALGPWVGRRRSARTSWRAGSRLVTFDGRRITRDALRSGGFLVVFPEGHTDAADSQVVLLRPKGTLKLRPGRETWSPEGFVAYSRVCTHVGCAVAQYEDEAEVLVCPCHQSTFDVLDGARPVFGPAGRPLPQLPLAIDAGGDLVAQSDFTEPVGPGYWNAG